VRRVARRINHDVSGNHCEVAAPRVTLPPMPLAERLRAYLDTPVEALWTLRGPEAAVPLLAPPDP
jgi:hypothetical protein